MLRNYLKEFCIAYLHDILIYSYCKANHLKHVSKFLETIPQHQLFGRLNKCEFHVKKVGFVGFIVTPEDVAIEPGKTLCIVDWPKPKRHQDVQRFLGLVNFYCQFIHRLSIISKPLNSLRVGIKASKFFTPFVITNEARQAFATLKRAFVTASMLVHFDLDQLL